MRVLIGCRRPRGLGCSPWLWTETAEYRRDCGRPTSRGGGGLGLLDVVLPPAEAAEHLGLSRPFITRLLDAGDIPSMTLPGSRHRVVRLADVLVFQQRRERRRRGRRQVADVSDDLETAM
ncbi:helix-turn-helix domain-containing protein [Streptomyces pseudogriseolus]|uniref:helix-turn-helix domain-containing protein n=1 Tax=Streptomyces pseudogriseolus TaxID=36817 RepID=UPI003FA2A72E